jgi:mono/diheme cytochrome c family protein
MTLRPLWLVVLAVSATISACSPAGRLPAAQSDHPAPPDADAVKRGEYLTDAANCVGCHTDKKHHGPPFAGGGEVPTPFGVYFSRNITPDPEHGIGAWSDQDFLRALRQGISPSGEYYFPAFPFPSFTGMTDRDILDIRAYLLTQKPAPIVNKPPEVRFPYGIRSTMAFWRLLFFKEGPLTPDPGKDAEWNRGRYLVSAIAHCGECHTPRNSLGAPETGHSLAGAQLAGADGNYAPNITPDVAHGIGKWSLDDIANVLKLGLTPDGSPVEAPMSEVVDGTSKLTDADRSAIAVYLKSVPALPDHRDKAQP